MVAAFEEFLRTMTQDHVSTLSDPRLDFSKFPDELQVQSVFGTLREALDGPRFGVSGSEVSRLPTVFAAGQLVLSRLANPAAFGLANSNPNSESVRQIAHNLGIRQLFPSIKPDFDRRWGPATHATFVQDKLDEIVTRRHSVAHTASALGISRQDLSEAIRFLRLLGETLERHFRLELGKVARQARTP